MRFTSYMRYIIVMLIVDCHIVSCLRNFALYKSAYQSSTLQVNYTADKAVDGNAYWPCSMTDIRSVNHTWEVDIGFLFTVSHVWINAVNCSDDRASAFQVFIGNHSNSWNTNKPLKSTYLSWFRCRYVADDSLARFVSVTRQFDLYMRLCEVEVYGECLNGMYSEFCNRTCGQCSNGEPCNKDTGECVSGCEPGWTGRLCEKECAMGTYGSGCTYTCGQCLDGNETCSPTDGRCSMGCREGWQGETCKTSLRNFALYKSAYQSSTIQVNLTADKAVDGNAYWPCSMTGLRRENHTWEVDIGFLFTVNHVRINALNCSDERASYFQVFIGNHSNSWNTNKPLKNTYLREFQCRYVADDSLARFVSVTRQFDLSMTVCEVEVYGECLNGMYSEFCNRTCGQCSNGEPCNKDTGECVSGCEPGWTGRLCEKECAMGTYGSGCTYTCGQCLNGNETCSPTGGRCSMGCREGWQGKTCKTKCASGTYGSGCTYTCGQCLNGNETCSPTDGHCCMGCREGWQGETCKTKCARGTYGSECTYTCGECLNGNETCSPTDGRCSMGCREGWQGETCKTNSSAKLTQTLSREDMTVIVGSVVGVCVGTVIINIIIIAVLKQRRNIHTGDPEMEMNETGVSREQTSPSSYNAASLCIPTTTASKDDSEHAVAQITEAEYEKLQDRGRIESSIYCEINTT